MKSKFKICGLTRPSDVQTAIENGAWALGFIVEAQSPRRLSVDEAARLSWPATGLAQRIAVTVSPRDELIRAISHGMQPDLIQLHGDESPARAAEIKAMTGKGVIKSLAISDQSDLGTLPDYDGIADYILLDAKPPKGATVRGGHGKAFDWNLLSGLRTSSPLILAGGLSNQNIKAAQLTGIKIFDISSGVERAPGIKDALKIKRIADAIA